jgi:cation transport protein ChaC
MWQPGFAHEATQLATLHGAHRSLCVYSHEYRGTPKVPGLVFGLKPGGNCQGMAFKVDADIWPAVYKYLMIREQVTGVYLDVFHPIELASGESVEALTFLVDETHKQYAGTLDVDTQLQIVQRANGKMGSNAEYVKSTAKRLAELGIADEQLENLNERLLTD